MRKSIVYTIITSFLLILSTILIGCSDSKSSQSSLEQSENSTTSVNIATATTAGIYYALGNGIADLWNNNLENIRSSAQSTAGSPQNILLMNRNEAQVAFVQNGIAYEAWNGIGQFEGEPINDIRVLTYLYPNLGYFVARADSGIDSLSDIEGKRIAPGPVGSGTEANAREILSIVGIDYTDGKDATPQYVGNAEAAQMLIDRQVDVTYIAGGLPHASVVEMSTSTDIKILPIEGEVRDKLIEEYSWYFPITIPKDSFKGQSEPIETIAVANLLVGREDLSEDLVYDMVKTIYDNTQQLSHSFIGAEDMKAEEGINGVTIPLHPGAVKYFTEQGVSIPDTILP